MDYIISTASLVCVYAVAAISLNLMIGYTGIFSINHGALLGIGAFSFGILSFNLVSSDVLVGAVVAVIGGVVLGICMGLPSLRLQGVYFIVASFAVQLIMYDIFFNYANQVERVSALFGFKASILGWDLASPLSRLVLSATVAVLVVLVGWYITASPYGRVLKGIRENESAVLAAGRSVTRFKVSVVAVASAMAALSGVLFAVQIGVVWPRDFDVTRSVAILAMVVLGGIGSILGSVVGAAFVVIVPQALKYISLAPSLEAQLELLIYGAILVVLMLVRRRGLFGARV